MNAQQIFMQLLFGGFLGLVGQGLRVVVGMKKLNDVAKDKGLKRGDLIENSRLAISLLIGFCAGVIAMISLSDFKTDIFTGSDNIRQTIVTIIASGYAGADFIDGFINKYIPGNKTPDVSDNDTYRNTPPVNNLNQVAPPAPGAIQHP